MAIKINFEQGQVKSIECGNKDELEAVLNYDRLHTILRVGGNNPNLPK